MQFFPSCMCGCTDSRLVFSSTAAKVSDFSAGGLASVVELVGVSRFDLSSTASKLSVTKAGDGLAVSVVFATVAVSLRDFSFSSTAMRVSEAREGGALASTVELMEDASLFDFSFSSTATKLSETNEGGALVSVSFNLLLETGTVELLGVDVSAAMAQTHPVANRNMTNT